MSEKAPSSSLLVVVSSRSLARCAFASIGAVEGIGNDILTWSRRAVQWGRRRAGTAGPAPDRQTELLTAAGRAHEALCKRDEFTDFIYRDIVCLFGYAARETEARKHAGTLRHGSTIVSAAD